MFEKVSIGKKSKNILLAFILKLWQMCFCIIWWSGRGLSKRHFVSWQPQQCIRKNNFLIEWKKLLSVEYSNPIDTSKSLSIACKGFKIWKKNFLSEENERTKSSEGKTRTAIEERKRQINWLGEKRRPPSSIFPKAFKIYFNLKASFKLGLLT